MFNINETKVMLHNVLCDRKKIKITEKNEFHIAENIYYTETN